MWLLLFDLLFLTSYNLKQGAVELWILGSWAVTWGESRPHHPRPAPWGHKQNLGKYCFKRENMSPLQHVTCIRVPTDMVLMSLMLRTGCSQNPSAATYLYLIWCFNALRPLTQYQAACTVCRIIMIMMVLWCSLQYVAPIASMLTATVGPLLTLPVSCGCTWIVANQSFKSYY